MGLLILGVALWWSAHIFKRTVPGLRDRMGDSGKLGVVVVLLASIVLMVIGYRGAEGAFFWGRTPAMGHLNNLLMLFAFYFMSPGPKKGALFYRMRHPMLTGFLIFTIAHLLVNGDVPSFILFGGLGLWSVVAMLLINLAEPEWTPPAKGPIAKDIMFLAISFVPLAVVGWVHQYLGPWPFAGG